MNVSASERTIYQSRDRIEVIEWFATRRLGLSLAIVDIGEYVL